MFFSFTVGQIVVNFICKFRTSELFKLPLSLQGGNEEVVCKNHLILGQHLYKDLEGRDFILYGGAKFRSKDNKVTQASHQSIKQLHQVTNICDLKGENAVTNHHIKN